jgi:hypothetical protein
MQAAGSARRPPRALVLALLAALLLPVVLPSGAPAAETVRARGLAARRAA